MCLGSDLLSLRDVDCVHWTGADATGLILVQQHAGQELWILVVCIQHRDVDADAGVEMLCRAHFLAIVTVGFLNLQFAKFWELLFCFAVAYCGMNCYSEEGFGLVVKRLGEDHLPTVWAIDPEVVSIRLPK